ncbi:hypothetical protein Fcan01_27778 [Folsomia candida]|uniref:Uncharacterized protein n=1 Tax=Folsomia candida TaxID=158441 RepID=A0A226CVK4_FOLCA|nr:hypothetical protein Fcan01_27778 [Folsomia candida]
MTSFAGAGEIVHNKNQSVNLTTLLSRTLLILPVLLSPWACMVAVLLNIDPTRKLAEFLLPNMLNFKEGIGLLIPLFWRINFSTWLAFQFLAAGNFLTQFGNAAYNTISELLTAIVKMNEIIILHQEDDKLWEQLASWRMRRIKIKLYTNIQIYWNYVDANINAKIIPYVVSFGGLSQVAGNYFVVRFWDELPAVIYGTVTMVMILLGIALQTAINHTRHPNRFSKRFLDKVKMEKPTKQDRKVINSLRPLEVNIGTFTRAKRNTGLIVFKAIADCTFTALQTWKKDY